MYSKHLTQEGGGKGVREEALAGLDVNVLLSCWQIKELLDGYFVTCKPIVFSEGSFGDW